MQQGAREAQPGRTHSDRDNCILGPGDFTATLANFVAGGMDDELPDLTGQAPAQPGIGQQPPGEALLSPEPTAGCRVLAAPPSAADSFPGSSGALLLAAKHPEPYSLTQKAGSVPGSSGAPLLRPAADTAPSIAVVLLFLCASISSLCFASPAPERPRRRQIGRHTCHQLVRSRLCNCQSQIPLVSCDIVESSWSQYKGQRVGCIAADKHNHAQQNGLASIQKDVVTGSRSVGAQPSDVHAASAIKPPKRGGVTWADSLSPAANTASDRYFARVISSLLSGCRNSYVTETSIQSDRVLSS